MLERCLLSECLRGIALEDERLHADRALDSDADYRTLGFCDGPSTNGIQGSIGTHERYAPIAECGVVGASSRRDRADGDEGLSCIERTKARWWLLLWRLLTRRCGLAPEW